MEKLSLEQWNSIIKKENLFSNNSFCNFKDLPKRKGIYFFVYCDIQFPDIHYSILYIGMSFNIKKRILHHETLQKINKKYNYIQIYFKEIKYFDLRKAEKFYIKKYNPPYNLQHRIKGI